MNEAEIIHQLNTTPFLEHNEPGFFHGRIYSRSPPDPKVIWASDEPPREDHSAPTWLTASEFEDSKEVLQDKVQKLARLLTLSRKTVVYTGAGISTSAGVGQAARGAGSRERGNLSTDAQPTATHRALAALRDKGLIQEWVQQNHDGLPQKAGFPQQDIIEIHGSWYDPSNPVVCYDGMLKRSLFPRMREAADTADLVLVIGTSLSGLNSDQVAAAPARRSLTGSSLGSVILNLQQTSCDGQATLRMFASSDLVLQSLLTVLDIPMLVEPTPARVDRALIPYNRVGQRLNQDSQRMWLDLSKGARVRLGKDHNCQGAKQPVYMHIGAKTPHVYRGRERQPGTGEGHVVRYSPKQCGWELEIDGVSMLLGGWWLEAAARGDVATVPVVNINPVMEGEEAVQSS